MGVKILPLRVWKGKKEIRREEPNNFFWQIFLVDDKMKLNFPLKQQENSVPRLKTQVKILSQKFGHIFPKLFFPGRIPCMPKSSLNVPDIPEI